tara:strand:- start:775 stop:1779 length:1005 start_codon:yes stop_codon:yes gene_type:complete
MDIKTNDLKSDIEQSRPNAKESTVKQYLILIKKLQKLFDTDDYSFLSDPKAVYEKIKDNKFTSIRNTYNAIIITLMALNQKENLTELIDRYGLLRDELNQKYEDQQKAGNISENQKQNFVKLEEIEKMIDTMKSEIKEQNLKTKKELNGKEKELLMMYTIWNMLIRIPTRNEFSSVILVNKSAYKKLTEADKKKNNYLVVDKNKFFFIYNVYKTSKSYGEKKIDVEKDLAMILRSYIKLTKKKTGESLFTTSTGNQISPNVASQLLLKYSKKYIGKNISSTILRHIVLSDKFADVKTEMEETAAVTGHSVNTMLNVYIKDTPLITGDDEPSKDE